MVMQTTQGLALDINEVKRYDALSDIPAAAFFELLDKHFPNSRFILTTREKTSWLMSISKHLASPRSRYIEKHNLADSPILDLRRQVYGRIDYDRESFSRVYDEHALKVKKHFQGAPGKLLVMDIPKGDGWDKLCPFIGEPIPENKFPHKNSGGSTQGVEPYDTFR